MTMTSTGIDTTYNGWTNYQTWNVALFIQNEFYLYQLAQGCDTYQDFVDLMTMSEQFLTPDGVSWTDPTLGTDELDEMIEEL